MNTITIQAIAVILLAAGMVFLSCATYANDVYPASGYMGTNVLPLASSGSFVSYLGSIGITGGGVTNGETGLSLGGTWTGSASSGWPVQWPASATTNSPWATNTAVGIRNAGGATNTSGGVLAAAEAPAFVGDASNTAGNITLTLKNTGTAGTYTKVTTDAAGRVTTGDTLIASDIPTLNGSVTNLHVVSTWTLVPTNNTSATSYTQDGNGNTNVVYMENTNAASGSYPTNIYASRIAFTLANAPTCTANTNAANGLNAGGTAVLSNATDMAGIIVIKLGSGAQPSSYYLCTNTFSDSFQTSLSNVPPEVFVYGVDWNGLGSWNADATIPGRLSAIVTTNQFVVIFKSGSLPASHVYTIEYLVIPLK